MDKVGAAPFCERAPATLFGSWVGAEALDDALPAWDAEGASEAAVVAAGFLAAAAADPDAPAASGED
jgi:hypothetical protein